MSTHDSDNQDANPTTMGGYSWVGYQVPPGTAWRSLPAGRWQRLTEAEGAGMVRCDLHDIFHKHQGTSILVETVPPKDMMPSSMMPENAHL